jgi:hypothetical protein
VAVRQADELATISTRAQLLASPSRIALLNAVQRTGGLSPETKGLVYGVRRREGKGFGLLDQSFAYRGNQGIDAALFNPATGRYAILEAKNGTGLGSLETYKGLQPGEVLRQGGEGYNLSRLERYANSGGNANVTAARQIQSAYLDGNVDSFASFRRGDSLYQLNFPTSANFTTDVGVATLIGR